MMEGYEKSEAGRHSPFPKEWMEHSTPPTERKERRLWISERILGGMRARRAGAEVPWLAPNAVLVETRAGRRIESETTGTPLLDAARRKLRLAELRYELISRRR